MAFEGIGVGVTIGTDDDSGVCEGVGRAVAEKPGEIDEGPSSIGLTVGGSLVGGRPLTDSKGNLKGRDMSTETNYSRHKHSLELSPTAPVKTIVMW